MPHYVHIVSNLIAALFVVVAGGTDSRPWLYTDRRILINIEQDGSNEARVIVRKCSPEVCRLRLGLQDVRRLDCTMEYLTVGGRRICGHLKNNYDFRFDDDELVITYSGRSPLKIHAEQVDCWKEQCDVTVNELRGEVTSPNYPKGYPPLSNCRYFILPANEAVCQVSIIFRDFDVEASPNCDRDKLIIGNESFCGSRPVPQLVSLNLTDGLVLRFLSDGTGSGRGFRAHVEQIPCGNSLRRLERDDQQEDCCGRVYREPYSVITSPGFLSGQWIDADCRYTVLRAEPNARRLRFNFRRFWLGEEEGCANGFLEIDGRRFYGCLDGYQYETGFDEDGRKTLQFVYSGPGHWGFILEVFQELQTDAEVDPNTEVEVFAANATALQDDSQCHDWGLPGWFQETWDFLSTTGMPSLCGAETANAVVPFGPPLRSPRNCIILGGTRGILASPLFPWPYPNNARECYEFHWIPGHCGVEIAFPEFDLERSWNCWKDHLLVDRTKRYCGRSLAGKKVNLRFRYYGLIFLHFAADGNVNGRGFLAEYRLLPC